MKRILVAVDFSKNTDEVIKQASILAKGLNAKMWVVHVTSDKLQAATFETTPFYNFTPGLVSLPLGDLEMSRDLCAEEYKREHHALLNLSGKLRQEGFEAQAVLMKGNAAELILEKAEDLDIDIIVMGSHGHGLLHKVVIGSVSEAVLRKAMCNLMIVPPAAE